MGIKKLTGTFSKLKVLVLVAACLGFALSPVRTQSQDNSGKSPYVILSGEFFTAMQKLANSGVTYGDRQEPLLEQIALSNQYIIKTNLTLIQQNEKIIHLLEELNRKRSGMER
jgi:hypothetical protein